MRKLLFTFVIVALGAGFMACEQEEVNPTILEPVENLDPGHEGGGEESSGVKGS